MEWIVETGRLGLRKLCQADFDDLCEILQDAETMTAYEGPFDDKEVENWLARQLQRYQEYGFGLWAVILKETGEFVGQCGITMQSTGIEEVQEVGYLFKRRFWHRGYATEAAKGCIDYAFSQLGATRVFSIIRDSNLASRRVAERNGLQVVGASVRHYKGIDMPHLLYMLPRP